jgi:KamA family protein
MKYKVYNVNNFGEIPQIRQVLSDKDIRNIQIAGNILPFKVNNYIIDKLIDWANIPGDPIFNLLFPQKGMLAPNHFTIIEDALNQSFSQSKLQSLATDIRWALNPNPDGQKENIPKLNGTRLTGIQHKYKETVLFFPSNGQTCHSYCTFCFRWSQFVGIKKLKFSMQETDLLVKYLKKHSEVTDILFTGGDPMVMSAKNLTNYIESLINHKIPHLQNIRIGTKSLSYWPYRFLTDPDADDLLKLFEKIVEQGYHLSIMAHFSHPNELKTEAVTTAIKRILNTGAVIRTQSPMMKHINDNAKVWTDMWKEQVKLGCIPYYMFVARDTGAQDYFAITLDQVWKVYRKAYQKVSGIARTVRGPVMSTNPGKVQILGINEINGEKVFTLQFLQGRNPGWVGKPFFAKYNSQAVWPAFNNKRFFFENNTSRQLDKSNLL